MRRGTRWWGWGMAPPAPGMRRAGRRGGGAPAPTTARGRRPGASAGLGATGLSSFVFKGGPGNDQLSVLSATYTTPGSSTGISFQGGAGTNKFVGSADVDYTLADSGVTSSAGGTVQLAQVGVADLSGGGGDKTLFPSPRGGPGDPPRHRRAA